MPNLKKRRKPFYNCLEIIQLLTPLSSYPGIASLYAEYGVGYVGFRVRLECKHVNTHIIIC